MSANGTYTSGFLWKRDRRKAVWRRGGLLGLPGEGPAEPIEGKEEFGMERDMFWQRHWKPWNIEMSR